MRQTHWQNVYATIMPERCSGLPVMRHDEVSIGKTLGPSFALHFSRFMRAASPSTSAS